MKQFGSWALAPGILVGAILMPIASSQSRELALGPGADLGGQPLLTADSPWNRDISGASVDPRSAAILSRIGLDTPLHPDFGTEWEGAPIGIPYVVVPTNQPPVPVVFDYADESDPGPYPIPDDSPIEGGPQGDGDRHILVLAQDGQRLWELYDAHPDGNGGWTAGSGAVWDLTGDMRRPAGWTSADAAGLPILPGLVRYDEAAERHAIGHALRFTLSKTRRAYLPPANHWASDDDAENLPPMGTRVRLRADFDLSGFSAETAAILHALQTYGMILADNGGDLFISGAPDARWNDEALHELSRVTARDLEVIEMTGMVTP